MEHHYPLSRCGSNDRDTTTCCRSVGCKIAAVFGILVFIVIVSLALYALHFSNTNNCDQTKENLQLKQAEESNLLFQLQSCQDEVSKRKDIEKKITGQLQNEITKGQVAKGIAKVEKEAVTQQLDQQRKENHLLSLQIMELHRKHIKEIDGIIDDLLSTQTDFKQIEDFIAKSKNKILDKQKAFNEMKEQINRTLNGFKVNSTTQRSLA